MPYYEPELYYGTEYWYTVVHRQVRVVDMLAHVLNVYWLLTNYIIAQITLSSIWVAARYVHVLRVPGSTQQPIPKYQVTLGTRHECTGVHALEDYVLVLGQANFINLGQPHRKRHFHHASYPGGGAQRRRKHRSRKIGSLDFGRKVTYYKILIITFADVLVSKTKFKNVQHPQI